MSTESDALVCPVSPLDPTPARLTPEVEGDPLRAVLRPSSPSDWAHLALRFSRSPADGCCLGVPYSSAAEFARMLLEVDAGAAARQARHWTALGARSGRTEGYAGLHRIDRQRAQCELCLYMPGWREQPGTVIEWGMVVLAYARHELKMRRVYALALERDRAVVRVLRALGMDAEGMVRKRLQPGGGIESLTCWSWASPIDGTDPQLTLTEDHLTGRIG
jgi:RimJ/RimL family protein N-acetyltransferase